MITDDTSLSRVSRLMLAYLRTHRPEMLHYVILTGMEKNMPTADVLKAHRTKIGILPNIYLGVITAIAPSESKPDGKMSQGEVAALRELIARELGQKIAGDAAINGDNAFARACSLTDGLLNALQPGRKGPTKR